MTEIVTVGRNGVGMMPGRSDRPADPSYPYRLHGWQLRSERPLPLLVPLDPGTDGDSGEPITVRFGPVTRPEAACRHDDGVVAVFDGDQVVVSFPGLTMLVTGGRQIVVEAAGEIDDPYLHTCLCGLATTIVSFQRGQPSLHAGVIEIGGCAVALCGHSGFGKSTTIRALQLRGHRLVSDDHAVIDPRTGLVEVGPPSLKLWPSSAVHLGDLLDPALQAAPRVAKFHLPLADGFHDTPVPLALVIILKPAPDLERPLVVPLSRPQAVMALHRMVHRWQLAPVLGMEAVMFAWATALSRRVDVVVLRRPDDLGQLDRICETIEGLARTAVVRIAGLAG